MPPVVEVIGIKDREKAKEVAQKTTRNLMEQGEDLLNAKLVIDANAKEVYTTPAQGKKSSSKTSGVNHSRAPDAAFNEPTEEIDGSEFSRQHAHVKEKLEHEAERGNLGNVAQEHASGTRAPDAAFNDSTEEIDGSEFSRQHAEVKDKLEHEAERGNLGNVSQEAPRSNVGTASAVGTAGALVGAAGAAGVVAGQSRGHTDASFSEPVKEVDGSEYSKQHTKVKEILEHEADEGNLGNVPPAETNSLSPQYSMSPRTSTAGAGVGAAGVGAALGGTNKASRSLSIDQTVSHGVTNERTQPDASFNDATVDNDGSWNHQEHEKVKRTLEHEAAAGHLGNIPTTDNENTVESPLALRKGLRNRPSTGGDADEDIPNYKYSHNDKSVPFSEVFVEGEPEDSRAKLLALDAIQCLQGRLDLIGVEEVKVDAHTGAITDQRGQFIAQMGQRRLSQASGMRKPSGGLVSPPQEFKNMPSLPRTQASLQGYSMNYGRGLDPDAYDQEIERRVSEELVRRGYLNQNLSGASPAGSGLSSTRLSNLGFATDTKLEVTGHMPGSFATAN